MIETHWMTIRVANQRSLVRYVREGDFVVWEQEFWNRRRTKLKYTRGEIVQIHRLTKTQQWDNVEILTGRGVYRVNAGQLRTMDSSLEERERLNPPMPEWLPLKDRY